MADEAANWDSMWTEQGVVIDDVLAEERTARWQAIEEQVQRRFGGFDGLQVAEIGSGHGTNAIQFVRRGASALLLDNSPAALVGAQEVAERLGVSASYEEADIFGDVSHLEAQFDVCCSFGLAEHFTGEQRLKAIAVHLRLIRAGGLAIISVPNRASFPYRAWMGAQKAIGRWPYGTEVPFTEAEVAKLTEWAGGSVVALHHGSFPATVANFVGRPLFGPRVPLPQRPTRLDRWAYELTVFATRCLV